MQQSVLARAGIFVFNFFFVLFFDFFKILNQVWTKDTLLFLQGTFLVVFLVDIFSFWDDWQV